MGSVESSQIILLRPHAQIIVCVQAAALILTAGKSGPEPGSISSGVCVQLKTGARPRQKNQRRLTPPIDSQSASTRISALDSLMSSAGEEARQPLTDELFSIGPAGRVLTSATGLLFSGSSGAEDQSLNVSIDSADLPPTCHASPILPIDQINPARSVPAVGRDGGGGRKGMKQLVAGERR